jgi:hypothetical protein
MTNLIYKHINSKNQTSSTLLKSIEYILEPSKSAPHLQSGAGCSPETACKDMICVKTLLHKLGGKQFYHIVLSFDIGADEITVVRVAKEIAYDLFYGFQTVWAVHTNTNNLHIHFVINSVSLINGKKYQSNIKTLYFDISKINCILLRYDLPRINSRDSGIIDCENEDDSFSWLESWREYSGYNESEDNDYDGDNSLSAWVKRLGYTIYEDNYNDDDDYDDFEIGFSAVNSDKTERNIVMNQNKIRVVNISALNVYLDDETIPNYCDEDPSDDGNVIETAAKLAEQIYDRNIDYIHVGKLNVHESTFEKLLLSRELPAQTGVESLPDNAEDYDKKWLK